MSAPEIANADRPGQGQVVLGQSLRDALAERHHSLLIPASSDCDGIAAFAGALDLGRELFNPWPDVTGEARENSRKSTMARSFQSKRVGHPQGVPLRGDGWLKWIDSDL